MLYINKINTKLPTKVSANGSGKMILINLSKTYLQSMICSHKQPN